MEKPPEEIRSEIDAVREDLGDTLEAIGDRVAPAKVMARAKADAADKIESVKAKVSPRRLARRGADAARRGLRSAVGSDDSSRTTKVPAVGSARNQGRDVAAAARGKGQAVTKRVSRAAGSVAETLGDSPQAARQRAEGNPAAAGLLAFAAGFFAAALLPPTERERQLVGQAKDKLQPLAQEAAQVGKGVAGELQSSAQAGVEAVKDTATDAVQQVKGRAQSSAGRVKSEASDATQTVARKTKKATKAVKKQAKGSTAALKGEARKAASTTQRARGAAAPRARAAAVRRSPAVRRRGRP